MVDLATLELAAALSDNVFYHVVLKENLAQIAAEGLRPSDETGQDNFPDFVGKDEDCVYLWPNVMAALSWTREDHESRFAGRERVVVRVSGLELERLSPDHEEFDRFLEEPEGFPDGEELHAELCARGLWSEESEILRRARERKDYSLARDTLRLLPLDLTLRLANSFAEAGQALMHRGPVAVERLELVELNDWERLQETFDEDYGSPWQGDANPTEEQEEGYYAALEEFLDGRECVDESKLRELLEDIDDWPSNAQEHFFSFRPLAGEPKPELSELVGLPSPLATVSPSPSLEASRYVAASLSSSNARDRRGRDHPPRPGRPGWGADRTRRDLRSEARVAAG